MRSRLATAALLAAWIAGDALAVELPTTRLTNDATSDEGPTIAGATLYWVGIDPDGIDSEIFRFDATRPIEAGTPAPCPLSNPCQLTENAVRDISPVAAEGGVIWRVFDLAAERQDVWIARGDAAERVGSVRFLGPAADGVHVVWWGWDRNDEPGLFLGDLARPFEETTALCPATNPCRITNAEPPTTARTPSMGGSRVVWTEGSSFASDSEVYVFDATQPADAGPPGACPTTNPCQLTDDDRGDAAAVVSASLVAWVSCPDMGCNSEPPDALHVFDGIQTHTLADPASEFLSDHLVIDGSRIASSAWLGESFLLDASRPFDGFDGMEPCPSGNPCILTGARGALSLAGNLALSSNESDLPALYDLLLYDVTAPLSPRPFAACPVGNPCVLSEDLAEGGRALSRQLAAWVACTDAGTDPCDWSDHENYSTDGWEIFVMPEAEGALVAWLALAVRWVARRR